MADKDGDGGRRRRGLSNTALSHVGMAILFVTWVAFKVPLQGGSPPVLDQLLAVIGGLWFGNLVRVQAKDESPKAPEPPGKITGGPE